MAIRGGIVTDFTDGLRGTIFSDRAQYNPIKPGRLKERPQFHMGHWDSLGGLLSIVGSYVIGIYPSQTLGELQPTFCDWVL